MRVYAVVVAAGKGARFGAKKQFELLRGKPVIEYSLDILRPFSERVIIAAQKEDFDFLRKRYHDVDVIEGGKERMHSVWNALKTINNEGIVLIHDAARPLIDEAFVKKVLDVAIEHGSAVPVIPIAETVKLVREETIEKTIDRSMLFLAQTPQAFKLGKLKEAYQKAIVSGEIYTDDSAVWERWCGKPFTVEGSRKNVKITTKEDMRVVSCLLG